MICFISSGFDVEPYPVYAKVMLNDPTDETQSAATGSPVSVEIVIKVSRGNYPK